MRKIPFSSESTRTHLQERLISAAQDEDPDLSKPIRVKLKNIKNAAEQSKCAINENALPLALCLGKSFKDSPPFKRAQIFTTTALRATYFC